MLRRRPLWIITFLCALFFLLGSVFLSSSPALPPSPQSGKTIIVGAGAAGILTAHYLSQHRDPSDIIVIDKAHGAAQECSWGNGGWISTGSTPMTVPANLIGFINPFKAVSEHRYFSLKPQWSANYMRWFANFVLSFNPSGHNQVRETLSASTLLSRQLHLALSEEQDNPYFQAEGSLLLFKNKVNFENYQGALEEKRKAGVPFEVLSIEQAQELEPSIRPDLYKAVYIPNDSKTSPHAYLESITARLQEQGVSFLFETTVESIDVENAIVKNIITDKGEIGNIRQLVVSAGINSSDITQMLNAPPPSIESAEGYHLDFPAPQTPPKLTLYLSEPHIILSSMTSSTNEPFLRLGGVFALHGKDSEFDFELMDTLKRNYVQEYLQWGTNPEEALNQWRGRRPVSPDGLPYIAAIPTLSNAFINAGHGSVGITLSAFSGKLLAQIMSEEVPFVDPEPFRYSRFLL